MKQIFIILLFVTYLSATSFYARYFVNVGLFGKIGYVDITLDEKADNYTMTLIAKTTGTAAKLTLDRTETYISKGKISNNIYIPDSFIKIKKTNRKKQVQKYFFNHKKREIKHIEEKDKLITRTTFDPINFKILKKEIIEHSRKVSKLDKYYKNDVLSIYLNAKNKIRKKKDYVLKAVGAHNDKKDITLHLLDDKQKIKIISEFSKNIDTVCDLKIKPIDKNEKKVDILIAFDKSGQMQEALLGDIFWIGKVVAKRVNYKKICK